MNDALYKQVGGDHYAKLKVPPVKFCQLNGLGYCESSVVKYVTRHKTKGGKEDLQKAIHFLELLIQLEYPEHLEQPYEDIYRVPEAPQKYDIRMGGPRICYACNREIPASEPAYLHVDGLLCSPCESSRQQRDAHQLK